MRLIFIFLITFISINTFAQIDKRTFQPLDVFSLEYASNPQISPDGKYVIYKRNGFDIMKDKGKAGLWIVNSDGTFHRKLTSRDVNESNAVWSPDSKRIAFTSSTSEGSEIYMYWLETGQFAKISQLSKSPSHLIWSPNGQQLAFTMFVPKQAPVVAKLPKKPKDAKWAKPARITDRLKHEADGSGYMQTGFMHIFTIPSQGGVPRQITSEDYNHSGGLSYAPDGASIYFSSNRHPDWEYDFRNSEVYKVDVLSKEITQLTRQQGPDYAPKASSDGKYIAFLGFKDKVQAHQTTKLYIMKPDGSGRKVLSLKLDRNIKQIQWDTKNTGLYFMYDDKGNTKIAHLSLSGKLTAIANDVGGTTMGRPYASGSYSVSDNSKIVYTHTTPNQPADLVVLEHSMKPKTITDLNSDLLNFIELGTTEEVWYKSSVDGRPIQGWLVKPPSYDSSKTYPLIIENHGGPILNYGDRFSAEMQLYAADGYIVFYPNPRGSTSYGEAFANLLYNNYPGEDYNDVMDGVDYLIEKGLVDKDQLYVTGGSAGGIMTAWIIGKNNRFKAAAVHKPVMNWISKTLVADNYYGYANSRYPGQPWENFETYWKFSPISLVGNVETPTMVIVGLNDLRTPPSEAKQLYHALKLRKIETVLVELPGASHGIARRPSQLISKVAHTLAWFEKYKEKD